MELMELTNDSGRPVLVNPMQVQFVKESFLGGGSMVCITQSRISGSELKVKESLDEVAVKWARAMRVEEME